MTTKFEGTKLKYPWMNGRVGIHHGTLISIKSLIQLLGSVSNMNNFVTFIAIIKN